MNRAINQRLECLSVPCATLKACRIDMVDEQRCSGDQRSASCQRRQYVPIIVSSRPWGISFGVNPLSTEALCWKKASTGSQSHRCWTPRLGESPGTGQ